MNSLEKARRFLARKTATLALTILPLAAVAMPAQAASVNFLSFNTGACLVGQSAGTSNLSTTGSCVASSGTGGNSGANALSLSGNGQATSEGGGVGLVFGSSGSATGSFTGNLPVSWDFTVSSDASAIFYNLSISAFTDSVGGSGGSVFATSTGSVASGTRVIGSSALFLFPDTLSWSIDLTVSTSTGTSLNVDIPVGSTIDVNPNVASTPEPASFALLGLGTLALGLIRRRKTA